jgi:hypothetical protein
VFYLQFFFVSPFRLAKIEIKDFLLLLCSFQGSSLDLNPADLRYNRKIAGREYPN